MQQLLYDSSVHLFDQKAECDGGCRTSVFNSREGRADAGHRLWRLPRHLNHSLWTLFSNVPACRAKCQKSEIVFLLCRTQPSPFTDTYYKDIWRHGFILICCAHLRLLSNLVKLRSPCEIVELKKINFVKLVANSDPEPLLYWTLRYL